MYKYKVSFSTIGTNKNVTTIIESDKDYLLILPIDICKILERIYGIRRSYMTNINYREYEGEKI